MSNNKQLVLSRDIALPREEVWAWLTDSGKTALWYGPYEREGDILHITMIHEEGQPRVAGKLLAHERGRFFRLRAGLEESDFFYEVSLSDIPGGTRVTLTQDLMGTPDDPWFEAGWSICRAKRCGFLSGGHCPPFLL